jgi:hypothetical protein
VDGGLEIRSPAGTCRFEPLNEDDIEATKWVLLRSNQWIGSHALLLESDDLVALDLETRKLRYLLPLGPYVFQAASADGRRVVAIDRLSGALLWGGAG